MLRTILESAGVRFSPGLTDSDLRKIEERYGITFPRALREFYREGVPVSDVPHEFPRWNDASPANVTAIRERIRAPKEQLLLYLSHDARYWVPEWGDKPDSPEAALEAVRKTVETAPTLIPIFAHRYVPMLAFVDDPPVLSCASGFDIIYYIIYYGRNLEDYFRREFLKAERTDGAYRTVPFWSDIVRYNEVCVMEAYRKRLALGME